MTDYTVEEILNFEGKEQIQKRIEFINEHKLDEIPGRILPDTHVTDYLFISYCHLDYKLVYTDIFLLQEQGVNIWYDKEMTVGDSWKDTANKYMTPRNCLGVIFYVSEASLKSNAVIEELNFRKDINKKFICISLPFESDYLYKGESTKGKTYLPFEMIDILLQNNQISQENADILREFFPDEKIYLKYEEADIYDKAKKIRDKCTKEPLLRYDDEGVVVSINDSNITKVVPEDFEGNPDKIMIGKCAFANCPFLEEITFPKPKYLLFNSMQVDAYRLSDYAFFSNKSLKRVEGNKGLSNVIPHHAFENCYALESIGHRPLKFVGERAFANCYKFESVNLDFNVTICKEAFLNCKNLKTIQIGRHIVHGPNLIYGVEAEEINSTRIEEGAFKGCESLEEIELPLYTGSIKKETFKDCFNLKKIIIHEDVSIIKSSAFLGCWALETIDLVNNNNIVVKNGMLLSKNLTNLIFALPKQYDRVLIPRETTRIEKFAMPQFTKTMYVGLETGNEKFKIDKGGLVDNEKKFLFFLNDTKNGFSILSEVGNIQPFALDNFRKLDRVPIYKNMTEIGEYVYYSFKNLKTIDLFANTVKLNPHSFDYTNPLERIVCMANRFDFENFSLFEKIDTVEFHNDVVISGSWATMPEVRLLSLNCKNISLEGNIYADELFIGKDFQNTQKNMRIFNVVKDTNKIKIDPANEHFEIVNGVLITK